MPEKENCLRKLNCEVGLITRADGSSQFSQGDTTVIAGSYGPVEVRPHKELPDRITVDVAISPKGSVNVETRSKESFLREVISTSVVASRHPRSNLSLSLQVLEDDGGLWSCLVNSTCLALLDSGISMKCLFAAVTVAVNDVGEIIIDPTAKQLRKINCSILFVFESRKFDVLSMHFEKGSCSEKTFQECLRTAMKASETIFKFYREAVERKFSKELD